MNLQKVTYQMQKEMSTKMEMATKMEMTTRTTSTTRFLALTVHLLYMWEIPAARMK